MSSDSRKAEKLLLENGFERMGNVGGRERYTHPSVVSVVVSTRSSRDMGGRMMKDVRAAIRRAQREGA